MCCSVKTVEGNDGSASPLCQVTYVTGKFACNNLLLYRKQTCWNTLKPETARTNSKKITANKNQLSSQLT